MSAAYWEAFFDLHRDLPREGPGEPADVAWAADVAGVRPDARICDAACGPGADIAALLAAAPQGHVTAMDKVEAFVAQAQARHGQDPRTDIRTGDMSKITGPYDLIWCAGAVYFLGVTEALRLWRKALAPQGTIAFSQPCWFTDTPSEAARAGWADYPAMTDEAGLQAHITKAGYHCLASRRLSDAAWEGYYSPLDARIAKLRPGATGDLAAVLDEAEAEAALWRAERATFGYTLCVVRPA
ncbi:class I SAM-dependent methyltransferase [Roseobacter weihaiensis]|uniref:class I SAM-dependent methyltransferase n=1 Tax=Roseobacter weihaiensis TaxID=2763262 RepID=UPI001D0B5355|nr:class I SAM-dependent methyltransferase [Roseobacter sp. H9]